MHSLSVSFRNTCGELESLLNVSKKEDQQYKGQQERTWQGGLCWC